MKYFIASCCVLLLFTSACKKKKPDVSKPVITMAEPVMNDTIYVSVEPEIHIEFTTTDDIGLSSLNVQLMNAASATIYTSTPDVTDLKVYPFHEHIGTFNITTVKLMKVKVIATDLAGNSTTKEIDFFVAP